MDMSNRGGGDGWLGAGGRAADSWLVGPSRATGGPSPTSAIPPTAPAVGPLTVVPDTDAKKSKRDAVERSKRRRRAAAEDPTTSDVSGDSSAATLDSSTDNDTASEDSDERAARRRREKRGAQAGKGRHRSPGSDVDRKRPSKKADAATSVTQPAAPDPPDPSVLRALRNQADFLAMVTGRGGDARGAAAGRFGGGGAGGVDLFPTHKHPHTHTHTHGHPHTRADAPFGGAGPLGDLGAVGGETLFALSRGPGGGVEELRTRRAGEGQLSSTAGAGGAGGGGVPRTAPLGSTPRESGLLDRVAGPGGDAGVSRGVNRSAFSEESASDGDGVRADVGRPQPQLQGGGGQVWDGEDSEGFGDELGSA